MSGKKTTKKSPIKTAPAIVVEEALPALRRKFSPEYKADVVQRFERCAGKGARKQFLEDEGLYSSHLSNWRRQFAHLPVENGTAPVVEPDEKTTRMTPVTHEMPEPTDTPDERDEQITQLLRVNAEQEGIIAALEGEVILERARHRFTHDLLHMVTAPMIAGDKPPTRVFVKQLRAAARANYGLGD